MGFDSIGKTVDRVVMLLKTDFIGVVSGLLKLEFLAALVIILGIGIVIVSDFSIGPMGIGGNGTNPASFVILVLVVLGSIIFPVIRYIFNFDVAVIVIYAATFLSCVVNSVAYNFIDSRYKKESLSLFGQIGTNIVPFLFYVIVNILLNLVILGPFLFIYFDPTLMGLDNPKLDSDGESVRLILEFAMVVLSAILHLFTQFAIFEIIVTKNGAISGFKRSFNLVKNNFLETILFSFLVWLVNTIIMVLAVIIGIVIFMIAIMLVGFWQGTFLTEQIAMILAAVLIFILVVVGLVWSTILKMIEIPAQYNYWKLVSKG